VFSTPVKKRARCIWLPFIDFGAKKVFKYF
jgi:hypothetical protein